jgi:hypothetical protein
MARPRQSSRPLAGRTLARLARGRARARARGMEPDRGALPAHRAVHRGQPAVPRARARGADSAGQPAAPLRCRRSRARRWLPSTWPRGTGWTSVATTTRLRAGRRRVGAGHRRRAGVASGRWRAAHGGLRRPHAARAAARRRRSRGRAVPCPATLLGVEARRAQFRPGDRAGAGRHARALHRRRDRGAARPPAGARDLGAAGALRDDLAVLVVALEPTPGR